MVKPTIFSKAAMLNCFVLDSVQNTFEVYNFWIELLTDAFVVQWLEHLSCNPGVESLILSRGFLQSEICFDFHYKY